MMKKNKQIELYNENKPRIIELYLTIFLFPDLGKCKIRKYGVGSNFAHLT